MRMLVIAIEAIDCSCTPTPSRMQVVCMLAGMRMMVPPAIGEYVWKGQPCDRGFHPVDTLSCHKADHAIQFQEALDFV